MYNEEEFLLWLFESVDVVRSCFLVGCEVVEVIVVDNVLMDDIV